MRYYRVRDGRGPRLVASDGDAAYDLTAAAEALGSPADLAMVGAVVDEGLDAVAGRLIDRAAEVDPSTLANGAVRPVVPDEVWAAGVTYAISEEAREAESGMPDLYLDVYDSERPEVFFKATASRTVGPGEAIGVRADSDWNVPEPELAVVLYRGEPVGYTVGNDVSSRAIEGANPLYLPQAKIYDRCCAIGPCVASAEAVGDPHDLDVRMTIERDGEDVFQGTSSTADMVRTCDELVAAYRRHNVVPELAVLLTGTSIVPPDAFTLRPGDVVRVRIGGIGTLENPVVEV